MKMRRALGSLITATTLMVAAGGAYAIWARRAAWVDWVSDLRYHVPLQPRGVEGMWLGYHQLPRDDPESMHSQFRVLKSGYARFERMVQLVVHWQVRNLQGQDVQFCDGSMVLHRHAAPIAHSQADSRNTAPCETVAAGRTSRVLTAYYTFVADPPNDAHTMEWGMVKEGTGGKELQFSVRLSPQQVDAAQLFEPASADSIVYRKAPPDSVDSASAPAFSILESAGDSGCGWSKQPWEGPAKPLAVVPGLCNQLTVALSGDTQDALLTNYGVTVLARGKKAFIPGPGHYGFAAFDDMGEIIGFRRDESPAAYRRYSKHRWHNNAWQLVNEMTGVVDACGAFYLRTNAMGKAFNCRLLHTAWHPYVCEPVGLTVSACSRPDVQPLDDDTEAQLEDWFPDGGNWVRMGTASADVILQLGANSYSLDHLELNGPVVLARAEGFTRLPELAAGSVFLVSFHGPYCLIGARSLPRVEEGRGVVSSRAFRVYDLRSGQLERTFPESVEAVDFWPAADGRASVAPRLVH